MGIIDILLQEGKLSRIREMEKERYLRFFSQAWQDNLEHSKTVAIAFPRWTIISGYYAMHDITKLLLASQFGLKVEQEVHATTIKVLRALIRNRQLLSLLEEGYKEFLFLANDLEEAKHERVRTQYYTGTEFMKEEYRKRAEVFLSGTVELYIEKMKKLLGGNI